ncbi:Polyketide synthase-nonribosomal peptide synthetase 3 [Colletotrichum sojae]|uniref:Polyketide synthase-nonribosomal peptide synthetase 3 n=1 Tax=Colletotrichum sojae TaxID=2175907 RepID=A0A8H6JJR3_9PEZI|nr:Polyketide synthase-nonribosomal peptide synthetase 3 [Colletotrichum sojae]
MAQGMIVPGQDTDHPVTNGNMNGAHIVAEDTGTGSLFETLTDDPACIVGMSCRLPGHIRSPSGLWDFIVNKMTAVTPVHPQRFNVKGFHHARAAGKAGTIAMEGGYFLQEDIRQFDNQFFGINNLEATYMDPQQRKLLEVVYECLKGAGMTREQVSGTNTGVYVANFTSDFQVMQAKDPDYYHRYHPTGSGLAIMSNRVGHVFNLQGPSMTIDTACSSSVYALYHALTAIAAGDCDQAIVAGANLIQSPEQHIGTAKGGFLSPTSTCHTFDVSADVSADGYGRGEAVNAILVKRLSAALRDGDHVHAVVRASAVNANGTTPGITLPDAGQQAQVVRRAYERAGIDPADTDYIECHGTGTPVGDPIEVAGLSRCFRPRASGEPPILIGSVKTNLGHSEAASGLASIIKVAQALDKGLIPPTRGVVNVNPKLELEACSMKIATEVEKWPRSVRRASINSFGYGGANGHVILESLDSFLGSVDSSKTPVNGVAHDTAGAPKEKAETKGAQEQGQADLVVLPVSAASETSLEQRLQQITDLIRAPNSSIQSMRNLAYTLGQRTEHLGIKWALTAACKTVKRPGPDKLEVELVEGSGSQTVAAAAALPFTFVFTGQGAQYAGMGKELLSKDGNDTFRSTIRAGRRAEHFAAAPPATSRVGEVIQSQPLCTAVQIGLVRMLRSWGIEPVATIGHSSGEIAAAYAAGLLTASQAILVAYFRGYAVEQLRADRPGKRGRMMAAALTIEAATALIADKGLEAQVRVACVDAPKSVTLSGQEEGIEILAAELHEQGIFHRKLETGGRAYHSHMVAEVGQLYEDLLKPHFKAVSSKGPKMATAGVQMFSAVGQHAEAIDASTLHAGTDMPSYWRRNLEQPVQFNAALAGLVASAGGNKHQVHHLIEIGPHPALKGPIKAIRTALRLDESALPYDATLVRKEDGSSCMARLAGRLFEGGHALNWAEVNGNNIHGTSNGNINGNGTVGGQKNKHMPAHAVPRTSIELRNRKHLRHELLGVLNVAGSGVEWGWRNVLRLSEMPWMEDHKVESQVVFPGAAYMTTAIEAVCQASGLRDTEGDNAATTTSFEFRNVNMRAALVMLPEQPNKPAQELHTHMSRRGLSTTTSSANWYDFSISQYSDGQTTIHCTGSIRVRRDGADEVASVVKGTLSPIDRDGLDVWAMGRWYERVIEEGLCFGPHFQSLTSLATDANRVSPKAISTTRLVPPTARAQDSTSHYPIHPIVIDACFQGAIMGGTAGNLRDLRAWLPVFVPECHIKVSAADMEASSSGSESESELLDIHTITRSTGVASRSIDCTARRSGHEHEGVGGKAQSGTVVIDMKDVRMSLYTAGGSGGGDSHNANVFLQRHPTLRVHWKPDVSRLRVEAGAELRAYVADHVATRQSSGADDVDDEGLAVIGAVLDLVGHRKPTMRVLELTGGCGCHKEQLLGVLDHGSAFPRCRTWRTASPADDETELVFEEDVDEQKQGQFDAVIISRSPRLTKSNQKSTARKVWQNAAHTQQLISLLAEDGVLVTRETDEAAVALKAAGLAVMDVGKQTVLAVPQAVSVATTRAAMQDRRALIIVRKEAGEAVAQLARALSAHWQRHFNSTDQGAIIVSLNQVGKDVVVSERDVCISLLETERELLATISPDDLDRLRLMTDSAADLVWVTGAGMLSNAPSPDLTLSSGLSRALMMEQPALRFAVLDIGDIGAIETHGADVNVLGAICENVERALFRRNTNSDAEFIQKEKAGLLHVSRFGPDWDMNALFRRRLVRGDPGAIQKTPLASLGPSKLSIGQVGVTDTIHFQQLSEPATPPPSGFVDVDLRTVSLNSKDIYSLSGRVDTIEGTLGLDFGGVISATAGPDAGSTGLAVGDRVVVWAPNHIRTTERVPVGCVHKLLPDEDLAVVPALLTVHATVLYALRDRAQLRAGESILIHAGAGTFGIAAIAHAQRVGAVVYTTVGSAAKREFLVRELGVPSSHIFSSRDASFVADVEAATCSRGVNVVVNSLVGDLLHHSWRCLADFGRFVEIGKRDLADAGRLDMDVFLRGCTFTVFDLSELFYAEDKHHRDKWDSLMAEVLELYREGIIQPAPITTFDVADIAKAYRHFHNRERVGKLVISLQDPSSLVPAAPAQFRTSFDPNKVYLLVGCLGGLGWSLSRWMVARGARHFLVDRLLAAGAKVGVVRGDVVRLADVEAAVRACRNTGLPIGGVVQAAMGLHEALFSRMPHSAWQTGIQPKWAGTWNLHNAIGGGLDDALDFFLLTSSISGSVGTATESNYCAANGFLDAFARWRRAQGKPAVSVGLGMISEVGYLHENPDIEALLLRKGIQPLNEDEFLQVIDMALTTPRPSLGRLSEDETRTERAVDASLSHILTGLEPLSMRKLLAQGFDVSSGTMQDPRNSILAASLQAEQDAKEARTRRDAGAQSLDLMTAAPWLRDVPAGAAATFTPVGDAASLGEAVLRLVTKRFSNLILMPLEQVDDRKPLPQFGVDSMVAAEFRTWFWSTFEVDVSFLDIMSPQKSLRILAEFVEETLVKSWKI